MWSASSRARKRSVNREFVALQSLRLRPDVKMWLSTPEGIRREGRLKDVSSRATAPTRSSKRKLRDRIYIP